MAGMGLRLPVVEHLQEVHVQEQPEHMEGTPVELLGEEAVLLPTQGRIQQSDMDLHQTRMAEVEEVVHIIRHVVVLEVVTMEAATLVADQELIHTTLQDGVPAVVTMGVVIMVAGLVLLHITLQAVVPVAVTIEVVALVAGPVPLHTHALQAVVPRVVAMETQVANTIPAVVLAEQGTPLATLATVTGPALCGIVHQTTIPSTIHALGRQAHATQHQTSAEVDKPTTTLQ